MTHEPLFKIGQYGLHLIQYPSKRWGFVGSVPEIFCVEKIGKFGAYLASPVFETEQDGLNYFENNKHLLNS